MERNPNRLRDLESEAGWGGLALQNFFEKGEGLKPQIPFGCAQGSVFCKLVVGHLTKVVSLKFAARLKVQQVHVKSTKRRSFDSLRSLRMTAFIRRMNDSPRERFTTLRRKS
jgi:hypothetical protein